MQKLKYPHLMFKKPRKCYFHKKIFPLNIKTLSQAHYRLTSVRFLLIKDCSVGSHSQNWLTCESGAVASLLFKVPAL